MLVTEYGGPAHTLSRRLNKLLVQKYRDIKYEEDPSAFCGYKVAYDSMGARLTLSMPQKTKEAAHEHLPGLLVGVRPSTRLGKGETRNGWLMRSTSPPWSNGS